MGIRMVLARELLGKFRMRGLWIIAVLILWYETITYGIVIMITNVNTESENINPSLI